MMKLGKLEPKANPKTLSLGKYLIAGKLPTPAEKVYREYKTPAAAMQMFGNDEYGDCTCAAAANHLILTTCHTGNVVIPTLDQVLGLYAAVTGFDPVTGANDNGASMTDVLDYLRKVGLAGHKILAWIQIDHKNLVHRQLGVDLFAATYVGVQLPGNAQSQFEANKNWEVVKKGGKIEGGHCILRPGYGSQGDNYVSWARWDQKASAAWSKKYIDEEYVIVTEDWIDRVTKRTPGGLELDLLLADLKALGN